MTLVRNSIEALGAQVRHLRADFEFWRDRTAEGGDLRQHRSQIDRIAVILNSALEEACGATPILQPDHQAGNCDLVKLQDLRRDIGSVHLVWEFFRDKFAQRDRTTMENYLGVGDDLAWACYKPCLDAAVAAGMLKVEEVKEPPLVFYSTFRSPFAQARTKTFHPQGLDSKDLANFAEVLVNLPVPVIGVPWPLANRVPELVLVGHEAGHVVAEDLGLALEAKSALQNVPLSNDAGAKRRDTWLAWCDEVFADLFGVIATGTAFVAGLAAEVAGGIPETRARRIDEQHPGKYPTPTLRMALCEKALERCGVAPPKAWRDVYHGLSGDSRDYGDDVEPVVDALLLRQWDRLGQKRLGEVLHWDDDSEQSAQNVAYGSLHQQPVTSVAFDVRLWTAGAMHAAHQDAAGYASKGIDATLARFIVERRSDAVRFAHTLRTRAAFAPALTEKASEEARAQRDIAAGSRIYGLLKSIR